MDNWKPKLDQIYWRINSNGLAELGKYTGSGESQKDYDLGNCYPSMKACETKDQRNMGSFSIESTELSSICIALNRIGDLLEKTCESLERIAKVQEKNRSDNQSTEYSGLDWY